MSDGGSNIAAALRISKINRLGCATHSLHRFIVHDILLNDAFDVFSKMVEKLKKIYKTLNYNTDQITSLQTEEQQQTKFLSELAVNTMEKNLIFEQATVYQQSRKYPNVNTNIIFLKRL